MFNIPITTRKVNYVIVKCENVISLHTITGMSIRLFLKLFDAIKIPLTEILQGNQGFK
jgi:hypothetical protein